MISSVFNRLALASATAGFSIATVLTLAHTNKTPLPCGGSNGCERVAQDPSSFFHGVPVSAYGMGAYLVLIVLSVLRLKGEILRPASLVGLMVSLVGAVASGLLTYHSITKIHATCMWCIGSAAMMVLSTVSYLATPKLSEGVPDTAKPVTALPWGIIPVAVISAYAVFGHVVKELPPDLSTVKLSSASLPELAITSHPMGQKEARVTIVEFADLLCPACREMHQRLIMFLVHNRGKVKLMYHPYPLKDLEGHEDSEYAATLAEQLDGDEFWNYVGKVYAMEEKPTRADLDRIFATFKGKHAKSPKEAADAVVNDIKIGKDYGVKFTPTYILFIDGKAESVASSNDLKDVIKEPKYAKIFAPPAKQGKAKK